MALHTGRGLNRGAAMTAEHWQHVKSILDQALEVSAAERDQFVTHLCEGDSELSPGSERVPDSGATR